MANGDVSGAIDIDFIPRFIYGECEFTEIPIRLAVIDLAIPTNMDFVHIQYRKLKGSQGTFHRDDLPVAGELKEKRDRDESSRKWNHEDESGLKTSRSLHDDGGQNGDQNEASQSDEANSEKGGRA